MHKEFEEWLDGKIKKHCPSGKIDRQALALIITESLTDMANIPDLLRTKDGLQAGHEMYDRARILSDDISEKIANCCGKYAGKGFCESFGCHTMKRLLVQVKSIMSAWQEYIKKRDKK